MYQLLIWNVKVYWVYAQLTVHVVDFHGGLLGLHQKANINVLNNYNLKFVRYVQHTSQIINLN